jgi:hypothetical protein
MLAPIILSCWNRVSLPDTVERLLKLKQGRSVDGILIFSSTVAAPILESLIFVLVGFAILRGRLRYSFSMGAIYIASLSAIGFALHGANVDAVGRAIGYGILASLYRDRLKFERVRAYWLIVGAHSIWNLFGLILVYYWNSKGGGEKYFLAIG